MTEHNTYVLCANRFASRRVRRDEYRLVVLDASDGLALECIQCKWVFLQKHKKPRKFYSTKMESYTWRVKGSYQINVDESTFTTDRTEVQLTIEHSPFIIIRSMTKG